MAVTVIVGGQFGSEGKGKVAHYFARTQQASVAVRVGGSNSGHTVVDDCGRSFVFRVLPTAAILKDVICVLGAGTYIDIDLLFSEIRIAQISPNRLWIDPNAYILTNEHKQQELQASLNEKIGSTQSGTGAAVVERIMRISASHLAQHNARLLPFVRPVRPLLRSLLKEGKNIIIEGTQGFGLSLLHSSYYPKVTSRDTTAASFVSEAGLSPLDVGQIILVLRSFPIRVPGKSGDLPNEIDWETVAREGGWKTRLGEYTSVTKKIRRVGRFDPAVVRAAIEANAPTSIVLNHADYFDALSAEKGFTPKLEGRLRDIEAQMGAPVDLVGLGPDLLVPRHAGNNIIQLRG